MDIETISVGQLQRKAKNAIAREFRGPVWVAGEIRALREQRGNTYITLVEPGDHASGADTQLDVAAWGNKSALMRAQLAEAGITLAAGMQVRVMGEATLGKLGKLMLVMSKLDVEGLQGAQEAEKRRLYQALQREGLIGANKALAVPAVPLRIGLVTSENSEGCNDFLGQLSRSPFAFDVTLAHTPVQGPAAPPAIARAIATLHDSRVDLIAVVRGGGGELDAFDKEPVARAICASPIPVWTGIGHTGDRSVADDVAQRRLITPTECGQAIVGRVDAFHRSVLDTAGALHKLAQRTFDAKQVDLTSARHRLARSSQRSLDRQSTLLRELTERIPESGRMHIDRNRDDLRATADQLVASLDRHLDDRAKLLAFNRKHLGALDPNRPLRLGFSITHNAAGKVIKDASQVVPGESVVTTLACGKLRSTVDDTEQE